MARARSWRPAVPLLILALLLAGCTSPEPPEPGTDETPPPVAPRAGPADPSLLLDLVQAQVTWGNGTGEPRYRTPGTPGHAATIPVLESMLADRGLEVHRQTFQAELPKLGTVNVTNVHGVAQGTSDQEIWLAAHWDSRAWSDGNTRDDCQGTGQPVLGANDGAAAVAVVTHAIELIGQTNHTLHVALFDAEDQGCRHSDVSSGYGGSAWAVGSTLAAQALTDAEAERITAFLLVDMPGDKELEIRREGYSQAANEDLVDLVFDTAGQLNATAFIDEPGGAITDDHRPFLDRGVRAVDLIHLDHDRRRGPFPWTHHTVHDTPENLSGEKMAQVTEVVATTVLRIDHGALDQPGR